MIFKVSARLSTATLLATVAGGPTAGLAVAGAGMAADAARTSDVFGDAFSIYGKQALNEKEQFCLMLASVLFRIDGSISEQEQSYLDAQTKRASAQVIQRIASIVKGKDVFVQIRSWYKALSEAARAGVADAAQTLVDLDVERTVEEEAFLIQLAQVIEGNDRLELFVSSTADKRKEHLLDHDLFHYITGQEFAQLHVHSEGVFHSGNIYTPHPYITGSLIPFAVEEFEHAQDQLFTGIIELLKDLNAKSVLISEHTEEVQQDKMAASGSLDGKNLVAKVQVEAGGKIALERMLRTKQDLEVKFDGSGRSVLDRLLVTNWKQGLQRKYKNSPQCQTIIKARFGSNKASFFKYQIQSTEARNIAKGINAAARLDHRLVKVGGSAEVQTNGSYTRTIDKNLVIHFH